jgi:hypothetical protein
MYIKVSKVFADFINKSAKEMNLNFKASVVELSENAYNLTVADSWENWEDYNNRTGKFRAIMVEYPANYYACPVYLTTSRLASAFNRFGVKSVEDLKNMIRELCEI